jgi:hypothetical protein
MLRFSPCCGGGGGVTVGMLGALHGGVLYIVTGVATGGVPHAPYSSAAPLYKNGEVFLTDLVNLLCVTLHLIMCPCCRLYLYPAYNVKSPSCRGHGTFPDTIGATEMLPEDVPRLKTDATPVEPGSHPVLQGAPDKTHGIRFHCIDCGQLCHGNRPLS